VARGTNAAAGATAAAPPAPANAGAPDDDSTVVFDIPVSLTGRRRSKERPLRRK
jgi:hypothetical protein